MAVQWGQPNQTEVSLSKLEKSRVLEMSVSNGGKGSVEGSSVGNSVLASEICRCLGGLDPSLEVE